MSETDGGPAFQRLTEPLMVPRNVAVCPECRSDLVVQANAWESSTGRPIASDLQIDCVSEDRLLDEWEELDSDVPFRDVVHRWWQSDWQPVRDVIVKWCGALED